MSKCQLPQKGSTDEQKKIVQRITKNAMQARVKQKKDSLEKSCLFSAKTSSWNQRQQPTTSVNSA